MDFYFSFLFYFILFPVLLLILLFICCMICRQARVTRDPKAGQTWERKEGERARFVDSDKFGFAHRFSSLLLHDWVNREFPYLP